MIIVPSVYATPIKSLCFGLNLTARADTILDIPIGKGNEHTGSLTDFDKSKIYISPDAIYIYIYIYIQEATAKMDALKGDQLISVIQCSCEGSTLWIYCAYKYINIVYIYTCNKSNNLIVPSVEQVANKFL